MYHSSDVGSKEGRNVLNIFMESLKKGRKGNEED